MAWNPLQKCNRTPGIGLVLVLPDPVNALADVLVPMAVINTQLTNRIQALTAAKVLLTKRRTSRPYPLTGNFPLPAANKQR